MAISTKINGDPTVFALTQLAASLEESAKEHKRMSQRHRTLAQHARRDQSIVLKLAEQAGSPITMSEGE